MLEFLQKIVALIKRLIALITRSTEPSDPEIEDPIIRIPDPETVVCYYGCPNSSRTQKLRLAKRLYK